MAEPFVVLASIDDSIPMIFRGTAKDVDNIVSNLVLVAARSPYSDDAAQRLIIASASVDKAVVDSPASLKRGNRPPEYPEDARRANMEGMVLVTFDIAPDGRANMATVQARYATDKLFLDAVRRALPAMRFEPAVRNRKQVSQLVSMPFVFSLRR